MSLFITFEGCEGSGKSYHAKKLYEYLKRNGIPAILTQEPGGTHVGEEITSLLKWTKADFVTPLTELFLFNASRAQLVEKVIKPALQEGKIVICDRYTDSTMAYQGYGRGLNLKLVEKVNTTASGGLQPDITIFLDITSEEGFNRMDREIGKDRIENEDKAFHERVYKGFLEIGDNAGERWHKIDAKKSKEEVTERVRIKVESTLKAI